MTITRIHDIFCFGKNEKGGLFLFVLFLLTLITGCGSQSEISSPDKDAPLAVLVTIPPLADLVRRIADDSVQIEILVPAGKEPETFAPSPADIMKISVCSVFFRVGIASETPLLDRLKTVNPAMKIVDLRENLPISAATVGQDHHAEENSPAPAKTTDENEDHADHGDSHDAGHHDCGEEGIDPHVWMSPSNLIQMAVTVTDRLSAMNPDQASVYRTRLETFQSEAAEIKDVVAARLAPLTQRTVYVFHPAYGYYCHEFGLEQKAIEAGGKSPKSKDLVELIRQIQEEKADLIFVQPEFGQTAVQKIAEAVSIRVAVHSPLGEDCLGNIRDLTDLLVPPETGERGESEETKP